MRGFREVMREHAAQCKGDVVAELLDNDRVNLYCMGYAFRNVDPCDLQEEVEVR